MDDAGAEQTVLPKAWWPVPQCRTPRGLRGGKGKGVEERFEEENGQTLSSLTRNTNSEAGAQAAET